MFRIDKLLFDGIWLAHPRKVEKSRAFKAYKARLHEGFSEDELLLAVKRYAESSAILVNTEQKEHVLILFNKIKQSELIL